MRTFLVVSVLTIAIKMLMAKPSFEDDRGFVEDRPHSPDSAESSDSFSSGSNALQPHGIIDSSLKEAVPARGAFQRRSDPFDSDEPLENSNIKKREVGVIYNQNEPIGILQPYQRSYRFIPVNEEKAYESEQVDIANNNNNADMMAKRSINLDTLDETYPSILANFKIDNKLDHKRNNDEVGFSDSNVRTLKDTIRKIRSNSNSEQFEEQLKSILDDMGLIEDDETHANKRETGDTEEDTEEKEASSDRDTKREACPEDKNDENSVSGNNLLSLEEKNQVKNDPPRLIPGAKREQPVEISSPELDSSNSVADTSALKSRKKRQKSEEANWGEEEVRIEREIQSKIDSLKDEVKRKIDVLKKKQKGDDDDSDRRKRQVPAAVNTLMDEETAALDPALNPSESERKPLIRKRRSALLYEDEDSDRDSEEETDKFPVKFRRRRENREIFRVPEEKRRREQEEAAGDLLGDEELVKRHIYQTGNRDADYQQEDYDDMSKRKRANFYDQFQRGNPLGNRNTNNGEDFYDEEYQRMRRKIEADDLGPDEQAGYRFRRRINDEEEARPQQLSDLSDVDLFGALPKSYDGELSRFKRVKRKYANKSVL